MKSMAAFYGGFYPTWNGETYRRLLELFELDEGTKMQRFSKGMQRQAYLAIALACPAPVICCWMRPSTAWTRASAIWCARILMEYIAEKEACVLLASHYLPEIENLCDHVVILNDKRVAFECDMDDVGRNIRKYRLVFRRPVEEEAFRELDYRRFAREGCVVTLMAKGDADRTEAALRAMEPVMLESFPLSLEEVFLYEMEEKRYDLTGLF